MQHGRMRDVIELHGPATGIGLRSSGALIIIADIQDGCLLLTSDFADDLMSFVVANSVDHRHIWA